MEMKNGKTISLAWKIHKKKTLSIYFKYLSTAQSTNFKLKIVVSKKKASSFFAQGYLTSHQNLPKDVLCYIFFSCFGDFL